MHRIDTPTAQIDKFGQGKNGFTNGDPSTGRRATDLNSDMWDAVQEEMANAIELTGIPLDKSKHNQLYLAIQKAITDKGYLLKANNLSDLTSKIDARFNLGVYSRVESDNRFVDATGDRMTGALGSTYSDTYRIVSGKYGTFWRNDGNALYLMLTNENDPWGGYNSHRPFSVSMSTGWVTLGAGLTLSDANFVDKTGYSVYTDGSGGKHQQANGLRLKVADSMLAEFYYNVTEGNSAEVSLHNRYGSTDAYLSLRNDGLLNVSGVTPRIGFSNGTVYASDGNINGSVWGGYLSIWLNNAFHSRDDNIGNRVDWGTFNREVGARATIDWVNANFVNRMQRGAQGSMTMDGGLVEAPAGCVLTGGNGNEGNQVGMALYRPLQILRGGSWVTIEG